MQPLHRVAVFALSLVATIPVAACSSSAAVAANSDACGLVTQHDIAKAFGFREAVEHKTVLRDAGNAAGVINERCQVFAYTGAKPTSSAERRANVRSGTGAEINIETWVSDSGPSAEVWLANFPKKLSSLRSHAKARFINGPLSGFAYNPPRFGAEASIGFQGSIGVARQLRDLWWVRSSASLIKVDAVGQKGKSLAGPVKALMATIVPGVL